MNRRKFLQSTATLGTGLGLALAAPPFVARAASKELCAAEPVQRTGYLPMYSAMANGYFAESEIVVKIVTIETGGGHTNAVLSGQAFAFIGGPEHNAFAKAKGAELRAVVHCVDRGNVYFCAATGQEPKDKDWPSYFKGKSIALSPYGGTPNSILRYLLAKWKLDAKTDVTLQEVPNSAVPVTVKAGKATIDRSFADEMWSKDGMISRAAWDTGKAVVMGANILKTDVKYEEIIDMSFVESVRASL